MKKVILLISVIFICNLAKAQVDPEISNYFLMRGFNNPAYIIQNKDQIKVSFLHRSQWLDLEDSPSTQAFSLETYLKRQLGFGVYITNDQLGFERINTLEIHISRGINFKKFNFSLGFGIGATDRRLNGSKLRYRNPDPNAIETDQNEIAPDLSLGVAIRVANLTLSGSIRHLIFSSIQNNFFSIPWHFDGEIYYALQIHPKFSLEPSVSIRTVGWDTSFKFATLGLYLERYQVGFSYGTGENVTTYLGLFVNPFLLVNVSYEKIFGNSFRINSNSFEIAVSYSINRKQRKLKSPRYL